MAEVVDVLSGAGLACGPSLTASQVVADEHLMVRKMLVETLPGDAKAPVLVPGNPVKFSAVPEVDDVRVPWLGGRRTEGLAGPRCHRCYLTSGVRWPECSERSVRELIGDTGPRKKGVTRWRLPAV